MAGHAADPSVLRVAALLETRQRLEKENAALSQQAAQLQKERDAFREAWQEELASAQQRLGEAEADAAELSVQAAIAETAAARDREAAGSPVKRASALRAELQAERLAQVTLRSSWEAETEGLRGELAAQAEELRRAQQQQRQHAADIAATTSEGAESLDALRARVADLAASAGRLREQAARAAAEVDASRERHSEAEKAASEAEAKRLLLRGSLSDEAAAWRAKHDGLSTQLANAKEHCSALCGEIAARHRCAYDASLARGSICERGIQTQGELASVPELRRQVQELQGRLMEVRRQSQRQQQQPKAAAAAVAVAAPEDLPWWALCLRSANVPERPSVGSGMQLASAGTGAAAAVVRVCATATLPHRL
eukprot:TRINITY_DN35174_c0_g2_i1.p1 TRINITY_DN35174_c0_g2~~TRINITY_DN35174_c0_g2_i1.p1  ORF type:complete len:369 (+),score=132.88 TRINITY_DN35174_c0_g2_i1:121-1227(+)